MDFTVEVERSLRVLDGAIMILCAVGGVQSQSFTVDQQMKRYRVPRIAFINKMDRVGADPERVRREMREKLGLNVVPIQLNMGIADELPGRDRPGHDGSRDVRGRRRRGGRPRADSGRRTQAAAEKARHEMLDALSMYNDEMMERLLEEQPVGEEMIRQTIREATINRDIVPLMMGSAFKNKGVQPLLDAVCDYLPSPLDRSYFARDHNNAGTETPLAGDPDAPLVAMVFKITDEPFGQLSYVRVYQGTIVKGGQYRNARTNRTLRVGRIVRMHANDRQDIADAGPGDIVALLAVECANGDTLCGEGINYSLESIFVAEPVISLSVTPASNADQERMAKALSRFMKEDPTFRVSTDPETSETIIAGMGELHLDIYVERMRREYRANVTVGAPSVSYREAPTVEAEFDYRHKKQTGGAGQFAHVVGRLVPLPPGYELPYEFEDNVTNGRIPGEYIPAVNKGFQAAMKKGPAGRLRGRRLQDVPRRRLVPPGRFQRDGLPHRGPRRVRRGVPPVQALPAGADHEGRGRDARASTRAPIVGDLNSRRGIILETEARSTCAVMRAEVPLANMFGYATVVRGLSKGMATFSMEMSHYAQVPVRLAEEIITQRREKQAARK